MKFAEYFLEDKRFVIVMTPHSTLSLKTYVYYAPK